MKPKSVEYGRVVNLGNYENLRFSVTLEAEEGESVESVAREARRQVHLQIDSVRLDEEAAEDEERKARQPWQVTPQMVADVPGLREKALKAVQVDQEHNEQAGLAKAKQKAAEVFGVEVEFRYDANGDAVAEVDGLLLRFSGWDSFQVAVPSSADDKPCDWRSAGSLVALGHRLAATEAEPEDSPF